MSNIFELPDMVTELVDVSKAYVQQEAVEPAKHVGRTIGIGLGAALLFAVGAVLLGIAAMRFIVDLFADTTMWSVAGYTVAVLFLVGVAALLIRRMQA